MMIRDVLFNLGGGRHFGVVLALTLLVGLAPRSVGQAETDYEKLNAGLASEEKRVADERFEKEKKLTEQYSLALGRLLDDPDIKTSPTTVQSISDELIELKLGPKKREKKGGDDAGEAEQEDDFEFPSDDAAWQLVSGEEFTVPGGGEEYLWGKPCGITVQRGERYRVVPHPEDQINRGVKTGGWRGLDRGRIGVIIPEQTHTLWLKELEETNFVYEALADGRLAFRVFMWAGQGGGSIRIKVEKIEAEEAKPEDAVPEPRKLSDLRGILARGTEKIEGETAADLLAVNTRYVTALKGLLARARSEKEVELVERIEAEIEERQPEAEVASGGIEVAADAVFVDPMTTDEWEALPGKAYQIDVIGDEWRSPKTVVAGVKTGERYRLVAAPSGIWGRNDRNLAHWDADAGLELKVGIRDKTEMLNVFAACPGDSLVYQCKADGSLCLQVDLGTAKGLGFTRWKIQKLVE